MKLKALKVRLGYSQMCLVFLLLLSGASQILAQTSQDPNVYKTAQEKKTDEIKTPARLDQVAKPAETNHTNDSLRAAVEAEKNLNQENQPSRQGSNKDRNQKIEKPKSDEKMMVVITEDVAEFQQVEEKNDTQKSSEDSAETEIFRPKVTVSFERKGIVQPSDNLMSCGGWERFNGTDRDPFDAQTQNCYQLLASNPRDPFMKPVDNTAGVQGPSQFYPNWQISSDTFKRSEAGFNPLWIDWIINHALKEGVDPLLILEVMRWESSFKSYAVSPVGAGGLMQFMPATAARFGINPFDEQQAIYGGSRYIGFLLRRYNGNVLSALAGYNAGEGAVDAFLHCRTVRAGNKVINPMARCTANGIPPYQETQKYAAGIWANYQLSVKRAEGISDLKQRIAVNVRFRYVNQEAVGLNR